MKRKQLDDKHAAHMAQTEKIQQQEHLLEQIAQEKQQLAQTNTTLAHKNSSLKAEVVQLTETAYGQEVTDVDTGVTEIVIPLQPTAKEPAYKKVRRVETLAMAAVTHEKSLVTKVKLEKAEVTHQLSHLESEKQQAEVTIKEVGETLDDTRDDYQLQITFTDRLQSQIEDLENLAKKHGAPQNEITRIRNKFRL